MTIHVRITNHFPIFLGCPWGSSGGSGAQKCPKTGQTGTKAQCTGCNNSGGGGKSGGSGWGGKWQFFWADETWNTTNLLLIQQSYNKMMTIYNEQYTTLICFIILSWV